MIGILTFHEALNYGAVLQCYGLYRSLALIDAESEVIDYHCEQIYNNEHPVSVMEVHNIKDLVNFLFLNRIKKRKKKKFELFLKDNIAISSTRYTKDNIKQSDNYYTQFIVGSDQIWNLKLTNYDYTYFLQFVDDKKKKNSYAGSIGRVIDSKEFYDAIRSLKAFNTLTVREPEAREIIRSIASCEADLVLDPTLLLSKEEWNIIADRCPHMKRKKYILLYMIDRDERYFSKIKDFAQKKGYDILFVSNYIRPIKNIKMLKDLGPEEFLFLLKNAEYIFTGSFHGICFSIIFEKKFFYVLNTNSYKERIFNLLSITGLVNRYFENISDNQIDYQMVKNRMKPYVESSIEKLRTIIQDID